MSSGALLQPLAAAYEYFPEEEDGGFAGSTPPDDGEEVLIGTPTDDDDLVLTPSMASDVAPPVLDMNVHLCEAFLPHFRFERIGSNSVSITFPSSVLPLPIAVVNRLHESEILLTLEFTLYQNNFEDGASNIAITNPTFGGNFPGRPLVVMAVGAFFSGFFRPAARYRCEMYLVEPSGVPDDEALATLVQAGFDAVRASRALRITRGDVSAAHEFLVTGTTSFTQPHVSLSYRDCPLFYLILEVCECFIKLTDHCEICGEALGVLVVKPALCDKPICFFGVSSMGLGASVTTELRRDPFVADFLICLASSSYGSKFFVPPLPGDLNKSAARFFASLPAVDVLARFDDDRNLVELIGRDFYDILHFVLVSNRAHLVHLPDHLKIKECAADTDQMLCITAAPERELAFQKKKAKQGNVWLWHGSCVSRWHSILHTGLQDLGKSPDRRHMGSDTFGPGVYQSQFAATSIAYSLSGGSPVNTHRFTNSRFPKMMTVLALVENVKGELLKKVADAEWTQRDLEGIIVRCLLIVKKQFQWNVSAQPPRFVPNFNDCLEHLVNKNP
jgi:hypothetical protein